VYRHAEAATAEYEAVRRQIAAYHNVAIERVIFCSGTTQGLNHVARMWEQSQPEDGLGVGVGSAEHHSNMLPWYEVCRRTNRAFEHILLDQNMTYDLPDKMYSLVALSASSNVIGPVWESDESLYQVINDLSSRGVWTVIDAAQRAPFIWDDLSKLHADAYVYSAHKMLGPSGLGIMILSPRALEKWRPCLYGGGMVAHLEPGYHVSKEAPYRYEAGTPPIEQVIAWGKVLKGLEDVDRVASASRLASLNSQLITLIERAGGTVLGNVKMLRSYGHLVSFLLPQLHAHDGARLFDDAGVSVRAGNHCAQILHDTYCAGQPSIRASLHWYNDEQDIERFSKALAYCVERA
jgi:cysteine desulfurase/selenocysteine lyase